jgi:CubicO group peptidase (beta-lactamase class C family)
MGTDVRINHRWVSAIYAALAVTACRASNSSPAQAGNGPADLSAGLESFRASGNVPAMAAAVFQGNTLIGIGVTGVRKLGDPIKATISDQWHLGSDTKAMTATLIGLYVDRKQLHFEDTLGALFAGETIDAGYRDVTLLQLLQHRGGAPGDVPADIWSQMWADGSAPGARLKAVRAMLARPPAQAPGTYVYANAGYMMAGAALERVAGATWEQLIQSELFAPLQMEGCGFGAPGSPNAVDQPWGHATSGNSLIPMQPGPSADNPPSLGPAGTVHCPLASWGKFLGQQLAGARGEESLVTAATMQRLQTPPAGGDYAAGWIVTTRSWANGAALNHVGSNTFWWADAWLAPSRNLALVVVSNAASPSTGPAVDAAFGPLIAKFAP